MTHLNAFVDKKNTTVFDGHYTGRTALTHRDLWGNFLGLSSADATIRTTPTEAATSSRGLTKSALTPAKTREVSMATPQHIPSCPHSDNVLSLPPGQWVQKAAGLRVFQPDSDFPGWRETPDYYEWDDVSLRAAHRAFADGRRDEYIREGERVYQRGRKRIQRARKLEQVAA